MWKAAAGNTVNVTVSDDDDDWETEADFENDVSEEQQRWGSKTVEGSGHQAAIDLKQLRGEVQKDDASYKQKELKEKGTGSYGYGGKFGVQKDRMDKAAVGHDHVEKVAQHASVTDTNKGFGGKFGVQTDRVDKSAIGWDHQEKLAQHKSQKDHSTGFGGKYGVQKDRVDKSAEGWSYQGKVEAHESQTDHSKGFGGKFGVQKDRQDQSALGYEHQEKLQQHSSQKDHSSGFGGKFGVQKDRKDDSAVGWDHQEKLSQHSSQKDHSAGFGGKFGVQSDRKDESAGGFDDMEETKGTNYQRTRASSGNVGAKNISSRFESMAKAGEEDSRKRADEERSRRMAREKGEREKNEREEQRRQDELSRQDEQQRQAEEAQQQSQEEVLYDDGEATAAPPAKAPRSYAPSTRYEEEEEYGEAEAAPPVPGKQEEEDEYGEAEPEAFSAPQARISDFEEELYADADVDLPPQLPPTRGTRGAPEPDNQYDIGAADDQQELYAAVDDPPQDEGLEDYESVPDVVPRHAGSGITAVALYDYAATDDDELSFDPDDIIVDIEKVDDGWWRGRIGDKSGLFPANYVEEQ